jgi:hypothetical protein
MICAPARRLHYDDTLNKTHFPLDFGGIPQYLHYNYECERPV